ncbi:hypothetical protein Cgig2_031109 [Carnegiea gigantea]|uniref:glycerophosphodiester phosphodiesterase n=1 Tax=Carnegiea gigantea TaxID=171969 RepID=A0A9Q1GTQ3_9CARY|nr:hypothetical protein Cgig2_031109 [Carnegiea gigantea]
MSGRGNPAMAAPTVSAIAVVAVLLLLLLLLQLSAFASAQGSLRAPAMSSWKTLDGRPPLVIARGGFSGLFPDSSTYAYNLAMMISVPDVVLWCDVQLTKDGVGICFPDIRLDNSSDIKSVYPKRESTYDVNGIRMQVTQGIYSRTPGFDDEFKILTVEEVFTQNKPQGFWLNIQHDAFYGQQNLSMRRFLIGALKKVIISHISSPEVNFLRHLARPFAKTKTKLVFRFLDQDLAEPSTNQTYGSLLKNLTFIKTFASGILIPKAYIWPVDATSYLLPHTSLVADAHKVGLEVYAADFANDVALPYNYSYDPIAEYLSFIDNGDFAVDGVVSDFPITPSAARDCFVNLDKTASRTAKPLVISHEGASGDYPSCTDISYQKAVAGGADVIDCPVQMSMDGVPFCLGSINLMDATLVGQTQFKNVLQTVSEIQPSPGIFSFSMKWSDIQSLTPVISNPVPDYRLYRNPRFRNAGKLISLSEFLDLAKNATSISGVSIKIERMDPVETVCLNPERALALSPMCENAKYLAVNKGLSITDAVLDALEKAGYNSPAAKKVIIQSSNSSVLKMMKGKKYELVYEVDEIIRGAPNDTIKDIKTFADSVVIQRKSVLPFPQGFLTTATDVVPQLHSANLSVYVQIFRNEFVTQAYDFFSDPVVEMNSFVMGAGIDGVITDFPQTAAKYKSKHFTVV